MKFTDKQFIAVHRVLFKRVCAPGPRDPELMEFWRQFLGNSLPSKPALEATFEKFEGSVICRDLVAAVITKKFE